MMTLNRAWLTPPSSAASEPAENHASAIRDIESAPRTATAEADAIAKVAASADSQPVVATFPQASFAADQDVEADRKRRLRAVVRLSKRVLRSQARNLTLRLRAQSPSRMFVFACLTLWGGASLGLGAARAWQLVVEPAAVLALGWVAFAIFDTQRRDGRLLPRRRVPEAQAMPLLDVEELDDRALVMLLREVKEEVAMRKAFNFRLNQQG